MVTKRRVNDNHQKNILLLETSSNGSGSYANCIRKKGFRVISAMAGVNVMEMVRSRFSEIDLIVISTNFALKELGGEQVLKILMHFEVPILVISNQDSAGRDLNNHRNTSFKIVDCTSNGSAPAPDNIIQQVLKVCREDSPRTSGAGIGSVIQDMTAKSESSQYFESSKEAIVFIDAATRRLTDVNSSMERLTGADRFNLIGKSIADVWFFESLEIGDNLLDEIIAREIAEYDSCKAKNMCGEEIIINLKGELYRSGDRPMIRCMFQQIKKAIPSGQQLSEELEKKEIMLKELQHRTKNTFAMMTGLVELKSMASDSEESKQMLEELTTKIKAIAELYQLLYENNSTDEVNIADYCSLISETILGASGDISIHQQTDDIFMGTKAATSLGLILVELLYNIIKYAYPDGSLNKKVGIELMRQADGFALKVSDNGVGLPNDLKVDGLNSSGLNLVHLLAKQLNGSVQMSSVQGTTVVVDIKS